MVITPNMSLGEPTVGVDSGLTWENTTNSNAGIIDGHNHAPGSGVQIQPSGLDISSDLPFLGNNATLLRAVRFLSQASTIPATAPDLNEIYVSGVDLYYNDGSGNIVQITSGGSVNATSSGISSPPASASFVSGVLVVDQAASTPGNIQLGSLLLGNNSPGTNFVTISPAASTTSYTLTLPLASPASTSIVQMDSSGNLSAALTVDGTSILNTGGYLVVPSGINYSRERGWQANGLYRVGNSVDNTFLAPYNLTIESVWIYSGTVGSSGTTEYDLKVSTTSGGSFTTILSTTGKVTSAAASGIWTDSGAVIGVQTGVTKPAISTTAIAAGSAIRFDLLQSMVGGADGEIIIWYQQA